MESDHTAWQGCRDPGVGVNDRPPQDVGDESFAYTALPPEGVDLEVKVRASAPVQFTVIDQTNGLPQKPSVMLPKRPDSVMPAPLPAEAETFAGYPTFVSKSFVFGKRREPHEQPEGG